MTDAVPGDELVVGDDALARADPRARASRSGLDVDRGRSRRRRSRRRGSCGRCRRCCRRSRRGRTTASRSGKYIQCTPLGALRSKPRLKTSTLFQVNAGRRARGRPWRSSRSNGADDTRCSKANLAACGRARPCACEIDAIRAARRARARGFGRSCEQRLDVLDRAAPRIGERRVVAGVVGLLHVAHDVVEVGVRERSAPSRPGRAWRDRRRRASRCRGSGTSRRWRGRSARRASP